MVKTMKGVYRKHIIGQRDARENEADSIMRDLGVKKPTKSRIKRMKRAEEENVEMLKNLGIIPKK